MSLYRLNHFMDADAVRHWICSDCRGMSAVEVLAACTRADWWLRLVHASDVDSAVLSEILALPGVEAVISPRSYQACYISSVFSGMWHTETKDCWAYLESLVDELLLVFQENYARDLTGYRGAPSPEQLALADARPAALQLVDGVPAERRMARLHVKLLEILRRHYHGAKSMSCKQSSVFARVAANWLNEHHACITKKQRSHVLEGFPQRVDGDYVVSTNGYQLGLPWMYRLVDSYILIDMDETNIRINWDADSGKWSPDAVSSVDACAASNAGIAVEKLKWLNDSKVYPRLASDSTYKLFKGYGFEALDSVVPPWPVAQVREDSLCFCSDDRVYLHSAATQQWS